MKAFLVLLLCLPAFTAAYALTAQWTGQTRYTRSPSGRDAISCEYDLSGKKFWQQFLISEQPSCPATVEAQ